MFQVGSKVKVLDIANWYYGREAVVNEVVNTDDRHGFPICVLSVTVGNTSFALRGSNAAMVN